MCIFFFQDEASAKETTKVFHTHEDVGKVIFALGHELGMYSKQFFRSYYFSPFLLFIHFAVVF